MSDSRPSSDAKLPPRRRRLRLRMGHIGAIVLTLMILACVGSLPYTLGKTNSGASVVDLAPRRYESGDVSRALLPPSWAPKTDREDAQIAATSAKSVMGTDRLGRSMLVRCLLGGAISLAVGLAAAMLSVVIGTLYGTIAGWSGGRVDAVMMRIVDVLFGLPYILLVVLLAVAADGLVERLGPRSSDASAFGWLGDKRMLNLVTLLVAIGGVSWLTMARVIRGQVLSLKNQPFMEACRAIGVPLPRQFVRHLLPNLLGPIIVYATLTVPTAILSESFLSFLGIGVQEPVPSWGNLAAAGLSEINPVRVRWWLLVWPCGFIAIALLSLNFVGESLRERFDPKRVAG